MERTRGESLSWHSPMTASHESRRGLCFREVVRSFLIFWKERRTSPSIPSESQRLAQEVARQERALLHDSTATLVSETSCVTTSMGA